MREERGSATVYALVVGIVLTTGTVLGAQATTLIRLQHEVSAAADLAAIAAVSAQMDGDDGCAQAERVAHRGGAEVVACTMTADVATVTTRGVSARMWGQRFAVQKKARAAPSDYLD